MTGTRCVGGCVKDTKKKNTEKVIRYWSNPDNWPEGKLPGTNDIVEIDEDWNMVLDIAETPELRLLHIKGILSFSNNNTLAKIHVKANYIWIQGGELIIGT